MLRKFVSLDGELLDETEVSMPTPVHRCFYCEQYAALWKTLPYCPSSQDHRHELVTLCDR